MGSTSLLYDTRNGHPLTAGYYGARHVTHVDVPEIEVTFIETDDGHGPYGAKTLGEAGIIPGPAAARRLSDALAENGRHIYFGQGPKCKAVPRS